VNIQIPEKPRSVKIQIPEPKESRSGEEAMTPRHLVSVDRDPKNRSYINGSASIHNLFNKELLAGIVNSIGFSRFKLVVNQFNSYKSDHNTT